MNKTKSLNGVETSEAYYKNVLNSLKLGIVIIDAETLKIVEVNEFMTELAGDDAHHFLGRRLWETRLFDDPDKLPRFVEDLTKSGFPEELTLSLRTGHKSGRSVAMTGSVFSAQHRKYLQCSFRELTAREETEKRNQNLTKKLLDIRFALDASAIVAVTDQTGEITFVNDKFCEISGYSREELIGQDHQIINSEFHSKEFIRNLWKTIAQGKVWKGEIRNRRKDGTFYWVDTTIVPFLDERGEPYQYIAIRYDITTRKEAEEVLRRQADLLDQSHDAIFIRKRDKGIIYWSRGAETLYGWTQDEALGQNSHQLLQTRHPVSRDEFESLLDRERNWNGELFQTTRDGRKIVVESRQIRIAYGEEEYTLEANRDITKRKETEENLRLSRERLALAMETADIYSWEVEVATGKTSWSENILRVFRFPPESAPDSVEAFLAFTHPEDSPRVRRETEKLISGEQRELSLEFRLVNPLDQSIVWLQAKGLAENVVDGKPKLIIGISQNITARKEAEERLLESVKQTAFVTDTAPVYIAHLDAHQRFKFVNRPYAARFGLKPSDCIGRKLDEVLGLEVYQLLQKYVESALTGENVEFELEIPYESIGKHFMHCSYAPEFDEDGRVIGFVAAITDISERRKIEEALRESQEQYEALVKTSAQIIWETNAEGLFEKDSPEWAEFTGKTFEERYGFGWISIVHPDDREYARTEWIKALQSKVPIQMEIRLQHRNGEWRWTQVRATPIFNKDGSVRKWVGMNSDITERKQAEEITRKANERFELVSKATNDAVWDWNLETNEIWWGEGICGLFGFKQEDVGGNLSWWSRHVHPEDIERVTESLDQAIESGASSWSEEYRFRRADGSFAQVLDRGYIIQDQSGKPIRAVGAILDISGRREAEEKLRESEERLRLALKGAHAGVWEHSYKTNFLYTSREVREMFGFDEDEELTQEMWQSRIHPRDLPPLLENMLAALKSDAPSWRLEFRVLHPTRGVRWIQNLAIMSRDANGRVERVVGINLDNTEVKSAEEKLRKSEENFRALVEATTQAVWETGSEEKEKAVTQWWMDITGVSAEEAKNWTQLIHPDDRQQVITKWQEAVDQKIIYSVEYRVKNRHGNYQYFSVRGVPLFNRDGSFRQWIGTFTDITERKEMEQALLESEARYRLVAETASDAILTINEESRILFVNQAAEHIFGYTKEELENQSLLMLMPENLRRKHLDSLHRYITTHKRHIPWRGVEVPAIRKDGHRIMIEISFGEHKEEGKHIFTGVIRDVTRRKETDERLRKSEERYRLLFQDNPLPMWVYDLETLKFLAVNEAACLHYGYSREEFLSMTIKDIRPWDDIENLLDDLQKTQDPLNNAGVWRHRKKDGSIIYVEINSHKINFDGTDARLILAMDVTERQKAEEEVRKLNESLEEKVLERTIKLEAINKELESFSYSVSHDLRAPLRAMDGFSFALLEDYTDRLDEEGKHYLTRIRAASQKMAQLIDDMLKLSRVSRGEITRREVNLSQLVREITDQLQESQPRTGLTLNIQENVITLGDEHLLRIALENLLGNAWKFTSKNDETVISFGEKQIDGETVYFVSDNGAGFDMTYAGKLFGAFQRLHTYREFEGTGIGLATVQRIINRHGGRIWAEGKTDEGATFFFKL